MRQPIFMKIKIIPLALLEIAASMHSPFCPIWRIFLPVYHRPSKRANGMILIFMKICCLLSPFNEFYIRLLCSFQFHQIILKYTVIVHDSTLMYTNIKFLPLSYHSNLSIWKATFDSICTPSCYVIIIKKRLNSADIS